MRIAPDPHRAEVRERFLGTDTRDGAADRESAQRVSHFDVQQMWGVEGLGRSSKAGCDPLEGAGREQIVDRSRRVDDDQVAFRWRRITAAEEVLIFVGMRWRMRCVSSGIVGNSAISCTSLRR